MPTPPHLRIENRKLTQEQKDALARRFQSKSAKEMSTVEVYLDNDLLFRLNTVCKRIDISRNQLLVGMITEKVTECEAFLNTGDDAITSIPIKKTINTGDEGPNW